MRCVYENSPKEHTMSQALWQYLSIKIHSSLDSFHGNRIVIRGLYDRNRKNVIISKKEKNDKRFNWARPTASYAAGKKTMYLNCFPGIDYTYHYASIYKSYLKYLEKNIEIFVQEPDSEAAYYELARSNLTSFKAHDLVIFGTVENLDISYFRESRWEGIGDFQWKSIELNGLKLALLGCRFSIWGDVGAHLVRLLHEKGVSTLYYVGKLGGLSQGLIENVTIATGQSSLIQGKEVNLGKAIYVPKCMKSFVSFGRHITMFSILGETTKWLSECANQYDFVDPEIGHMASAAQIHGVDFNYMHLVSDNVRCIGQENLSNERIPSVLEKRQIIHKKLSELIGLNLLLKSISPYNAVNPKAMENIARFFDIKSLSELKERLQTDLPDIFQDDPECKHLLFLLIAKACQDQKEHRKILKNSKNKTTITLCSYFELLYKSPGINLKQVSNFFYLIALSTIQVNSLNKYCFSSALFSKPMNEISKVHLLDASVETTFHSGFLKGKRF